MHRTIIALLTATTLVVSQFAVAGYACQRDVPVAQDMTGMHDCPSKQVQASPICKPHCEKNAQISVSGSNQVPPPAFSPMVWIDLTSQLISLPQQHALHIFTALDPPDIYLPPPLRIQYQTFLI